MVAWLFVALLCGQVAASSFCFEAELANEITIPFEIVERKGASGGLTVGIPEGAGCGQIFRGDGGTSTYRIPLTEDGTYSVWLRTWWNGTCSDSIFLSVGGSKSRRASSGKHRRWHWVWGGSWKLVRGPMEIQLKDREDGIWVDQIFITTEKAQSPAGPLEANIIPGVADAECREPRLHLGAAPRAEKVLPPTDFRMAHWPFSVVQLEPVRTIVTGPGESARLPLWLRSNSLKEAEGEIEVVTEAPVRIEPESKQSFHIKEGVPLHNVQFTIVPRPGMERRGYPLFVRVRHKGGRLEGRRLVLLHPFDWVVTNDMPCPETTGISTRSPVEANVGLGFPGPAQGVSWRPAGDDATTPFGLLDMRKAVADKTYVMAYAYTCLVSPEEEEYCLDVRHDDMVRLWLNGVPVITSLRSMPSDSTRKLVKVKFKKGDNDVLVKICQKKNYWEFGLRVLTVDGRPAPVFGRSVARLVGDGRKRP